MATATPSITLRMFSKDGCVRCDALLESLQEAGVSVDVVKEPTKEERQKTLDDAGLTMFPVVFDLGVDPPALVGGPVDVRKFMRAKGVRL